MSNSYFFLQAEKSDENSIFLDSLETYAKDKAVQIYVIDRPLGENRYVYSYTLVSGKSATTKGEK